MAFTINNGALYQLFDRPHMKIAIESCVGVVELWPLQTVQEMENDAKYTEDLQVRFSCTMARAMLRLSHGINPSVAEAVYEGMDEIPGCDPEIVQALTRANQAYDVMRNYSETNNADLFFEAADILGIFIDAHVETEVRNILQRSWSTFGRASAWASTAERWKMSTTATLSPRPQGRSPGDSSRRSRWVTV